MRITPILALVVFCVIFSNPAFSQQERPIDKALIAKPNPALSGIKELSVEITPAGLEPNAEDLLCANLKAEVINLLYDAGFKVSRACRYPRVENPFRHAQVRILWTVCGICANVAGSCRFVARQRATSYNR